MVTEVRQRDIVELTQDVQRLVQAVRHLTECQQKASQLEQPYQRMSQATTVRHHLYLRRYRDRLFPEALFSDPAWDMLLDLYAADLEGGAEYITSLCLASAVPNTTALRWLSRLTEEGLAVRVPDATDKRRSLVSITPAAKRMMDTFFERIEAIRRHG